MNIQMQLCGLIIMLLLLYFCLRQKSLWMTTEKRFIQTLIVCIICVCFDMLSIAAIVNRDLISGFTLEFICKTYLVTLLCMGHFCLLYTRVDLQRPMEELIIRWIGRVLLVGASILIYCLPIHYYCRGRVTYTYGPSVQTAYVFAFCCIVITMYRVIRYGKRMNPKRARAIRFWMYMWITAVLIQACNNAFLLVGFATAMGMVILFFELENPEANMDKETGAFNSHALLEYLKQQYEHGDHFCLLLLSLEQYQRDEVEIRNIDKVLVEMIRYLETIDDAKVFKRVEYDIVLVFRHKNQLDRALERIRERFSESWSAKDGSRPFLIEPFYIVLEDSSIVSGAEEVFRIVGACKAQMESHVRNKIVYIDQEMVIRRRGEEDIANTIRRAIKENRVEVFYQPIYSLKQKKFVSAEALVRIRNKDGSILSPGAFIPVAEKNGSIRRLGEIVFEKVCRFISESRIRSYGLNYIEVNLSVEQCEDQELADNYIKIMEKYEVVPELVNLEITETASIKTRNIMLQNMEKLISYGSQFSLDDFGNGESNLNYIVDMPVEIIKFDRDMTQAFFHKEKARFVMSAAKNMIHEMGLGIVAEGVETAEQVATLEQFGVDFVQGYYFSKPLPEEEFLEFLRQHQMH